MIFRALSFLMLVVLTACGADGQFASDEAVARAHYVSTDPPSITLITSINNRSNTGAHSALIINGSERILFDPSGSWDQPAAPERNDVRFGMSPPFLLNYLQYQGIDPFRVVQQTVIVTPEVAALAIVAAENYGAVPKAACTTATSKILRGLPGFEGLASTLFPKALSKSFATLPGVTETMTTFAQPDGTLLTKPPPGVTVIGNATDTTQ